MKNVPNAITICRAVLSLLLPIMPPLSVQFFFLYSLCGISDVVDGFIARRFCVVSVFGAALDSVADVIFFACVLWAVIPALPIAVWMICWIVGIAAIRITSLTIHFFRFHKAAFLHTYANKITGVTIFLSPFIYIALGINAAIILVCAIATISAIEELSISATSKELQRDIKGIFSR